MIFVFIGSGWSLPASLALLGARACWLWRVRSAARQALAR
jgi:hypothetical protein